MELSAFFILSQSYFVLHIFGVPLAFIYSLVFIFFGKIEIKLLFTVLACATIILLSSITITGYFEVKDLILWLYSLVILSFITQVQITQKEAYAIARNNFLFLSISGALDFLLRIFVGEKLIAFVPNLSFIRHAQPNPINIGNIEFYRIQGVFSEPSYFAVCAVLIQLALILFSKKQNYYFFCITCFFVFLSYSVTGFILLAPLTALLYMRSNRNLRRIILVTIFLISFVLVIDQSILTHVMMKLSGEHVSGAGRWQKVQLALQLITKNPIFGYQPGYFVSINGTLPGNLFLNILIEFGLIGAMIFLLFCLTNFPSFFQFQHCLLWIIYIIVFSTNNMHYITVFLITPILLETVSKAEMKNNELYLPVSSRD